VTFTPAPDHVAEPATGVGAGVLVLHAWWGRNADVTAYADRLGEAGFVALAPDLVGPPVDTVAQAEDRTETLDFGAVTRAVSAALDRLRGHDSVIGPVVGIVGFSLGAAFALRMAAERRDVGAVATYYGTAGEADWSTTRAGFLCHFAESDPYEPDEEIHALEAQLRRSGRDVTIERYAGTGHWFAERSQPAYDHQAAELAWERTLAFLGQRLG
jgi:carboxymethylenebutenolidase